MDCKQRGHQSAWPQSGGHLPQNEKQQEHGGGVQQQVGEMMPSGVLAIELPVHHVGNPRQRVPIAD